MNIQLTDRVKTILLVGLQFLFIGWLLSRAFLHKVSAVALTIILLSILLALWSIAAMRKSKLRISPQPSSKAILITNGPYRFIRHPMYTSVLMGSLGLVINHFSFMSVAVLVALALVLIIKLSWEEKMLIEKFHGYKNYMHRTARLIPFLF